MLSPFLMVNFESLIGDVFQQGRRDEAGNLQAKSSSAARLLSGVANGIERSANNHRQKLRLDSRSGL